MENIARSTTRSFLFLLLIALATLLFRLGSLPFIGSDEPRYARIAEEMHSSRSWVTPLLEGHPWLEKPPLYYWLSIPILSALGAGETSARLAPAACAFLAVLAIWLLGRRLCGPLAGLYAGIVLLTSMGFVAFGRSASTDMPLTAFLTMALALFTLGVIDICFPAGLVVAGYALLGLAVLAKGPVALVLAAGSCGLYWWLDERGGSLRRLRLALGLSILALVTLPWFLLAFRQNGYSFVSIFFVNHNLARFVSDIHHHSQPFYYYLPVLLGLMFPWSGWLPCLWHGALDWRLAARREWSSATLFLACWAVFPLLFFSVSQSKLPGYILPCLPPLSLLLGKRIAESTHAALLLSRPARWFYLLISLALACSLPWVFHVRYGGQWKIGLGLGVIIAAPGIFSYAFASGRPRLAFLGTMLQGVFLILGITWMAFPALAEYHSARSIARLAVDAREHSEPIVTYRFFHHTLQYYTGYQVAANLPDAKAVVRYTFSHPRVLVVTEASRISELDRVSGFSVTDLGRQGKLRLLRIAHD